MIQFDVPADIRAFLDGSFEKDALPGLRQAARRAGVYGPQLPAELGGQNLGTTALARPRRLADQRPQGVHHRGARRCVLRGDGGTRTRCRLRDGATLLYASRLMVLNACWRIERGLPHRTEVAMVKTFVAEALQEIVDKALQVHGGWGYTSDFPFERYYRDARAARIDDGPSEVHRMSVARAVLKQVRDTGTARAVSGDVATATPAASTQTTA